MFLANCGVEVALWHWGFSAVALVGVKLVDGEAWDLVIPGEKFPEYLELVYAETWGSEASASALLVGVEAEDVEAWHLRSSLAVDLPADEDVEDVEALCLEGDFAVGLLVEVEDVGASHSEGVAERSGCAEVKDFAALRLEAASVVGLLEGAEAETLYFGDAVGFLVCVEVEKVEVLYLWDAIERLEDAEAEEGALGLPEDAEVEENAAEHSEDFEFGEYAVEWPEDAGVEGVEALRLKASAVENLVVVEATQVFELAFGSSDPDLGLAFCLEDSYSLAGQVKEPLLEMGLETDG